MRLKNEIFATVLDWLIREHYVIDQRDLSHKTGITATMMLREGVRIEHVSKMLGHTNIVTTQRYAKVLADDIRKDFSMIEQKLTLKTKNNEKDYVDGFGGLPDDRL